MNCKCSQQKCLRAMKCPSKKKIISDVYAAFLTDPEGYKTKYHTLAATDITTSRCKRRTGNQLAALCASNAQKGDQK